MTVRTTSLRKHSRGKRVVRRRSGSPPTSSPQRQYRSNKSRLSPFSTLFSSPKSGLRVTKQQVSSYLHRIFQKKSTKKTKFETDLLKNLGKIQKDQLDEKLYINVISCLFLLANNVPDEIKTVMSILERIVTDEVLTLANSNPFKWVYIHKLGIECLKTLFKTTNPALKSFVVWLICRGISPKELSNDQVEFIIDNIIFTYIYEEDVAKEVLKLITKFSYHQKFHLTDHLEGVKNDIVKKLVKKGVLPILLYCIKEGKPEVKEYAADALNGIGLNETVERYILKFLPKLTKVVRTLVDEKLSNKTIENVLQLLSHYTVLTTNKDEYGTFESRIDGQQVRNTFVTDENAIPLLVDVVNKSLIEKEKVGAIESIINLLYIATPEERETIKNADVEEALVNVFDENKYRTAAKEAVRALRLLAKDCNIAKKFRTETDIVDKLKQRKGTSWSPVWRTNYENAIQQISFCESA